MTTQLGTLSPGVILATHLHRVPRSRMSGGINPFPHTSSRYAEVILVRNTTANLIKAVDTVEDNLFGSAWINIRSKLLRKLVYLKLDDSESCTNENVQRFISFHRSAHNNHEYRFRGQKPKVVQQRPLTV
jgi:hypothetical protein